MYELQGKQAEPLFLLNSFSLTICDEKEADNRASIAIKEMGDRFENIFAREKAEYEAEIARLKAAARRRAMEKVRPEDGYDTPGCSPFLWWAAGVVAVIGGWWVL
jgi:hypothetical protein